MKVLEASGAERNAFSTLDSGGPHHCSEVLTTTVRVAEFREATSRHLFA